VVATAEVSHATPTPVPLYRLVRSFGGAGAPYAIELPADARRIVGRDRHADMRLVDDARDAAGMPQFVSRLHARLRVRRREATGEHLFTVSALARSDGAGFAGVFVDGAPLTCERPAILRHGSRLVFGSLRDEDGGPYTRFSYDVVALPGAAPPPPRPPCAVVNLAVTRDVGVEEEDRWSTEAAARRRRRNASVDDAYDTALDPGDAALDEGEDGFCSEIAGGGCAFALWGGS